MASPVPVRGGEHPAGGEADGHPATAGGAPTFGSAGQPPVDQGLVFDLGMHRGDDTSFYLDKGFRVIAVEAAPKFVELAVERFGDALGRRRLEIVPRAIWEAKVSEIPFFLHADPRRGWNSAFRAAAERDGSSSEVIHVPTTSLPALFDRYGVPRYLKCDLERSDAIALDQLENDGRRPAFVSFEIECPTFITRLAAMGYDRFQLVNQASVHRMRLRRPSREGRFAALTAGGHTSGPFGLDLPSAFWGTAEVTLARFVDWQRRLNRTGPAATVMKRIARLTGRSWLYYRGWMDIHATTAGQLAAGSGLPGQGA